MAWKELLQQQNETEQSVAEQDPGPVRDRTSLIRRICGDSKPSGDTAAEPAANREPITLPDGYVRRSPVQQYHTAPDYLRRRVRKIILGVLVLVFFVLLMAVLLKTGLIRTD
ncbi:MAG: hypothetical protein J5789_06100 [Oscillospiraceae bacterium]|nr:hypothetical protein [Oscillospiraceae bacterium]